MSTGDNPLLDTLNYIWHLGSVRVQSDYARAHAAAVAMAASLGMITTRVAKDSYGREWRLTAKGLRVLEASSI
jgi:hypothetical protein